MTWDEIWPLLRQGTVETLQMTVWATVITAVLGALLGLALVVTDRRGLAPLAPVHHLLGLVVNIGRSIPFIILLVALLPVTRAIVGTTIGTTAAIVPLAVSAIPFYARLVETSLREVDPGVVDAARAMGASRPQIAWKVLLREARPGLIAGLVVTFVALIGYSAMAGAIGGGGLGDIANRYGYQRFETNVTYAVVVAIVVLVQIVQLLGDRLVRRLSHR
ncbi:methionine ABC transporter permease [Actinomadura rupiterrae]|uniref:methionine ABC transporter permease n=1 Tax=Actinomadura rupiterrae TaxID=559627 RepID=UPI0020A57EB6|nr:methionine ABC transporter permease [Actinomadura rupiterrae]MCP2335675.1 D-methionine transport system permease protein [Actinomadura rupiterrae]